MGVVLDRFSLKKWLLDGFENLYFGVKTLCFTLREEWNVIHTLYSKSSFALIDRMLRRLYRYQSPYTICRKALEKRGDLDVYTYGETPLTALSCAARHFAVTQDDRVIEMGAGRGRVALFFAAYVGCQVIAYEELLELQPPKALLDTVPNLSWIHADMHQADLEWATVVYLYGTLLSDDEIRQFCEKVPPSLKVITVGYPLEAYDSRYQTIQECPALFPWGKTTFYLNRKR